MESLEFRDNRVILGTRGQGVDRANMMGGKAFQDYQGLQALQETWAYQARMGSMLQRELRV